MAGCRAGVVPAPPSLSGSTMTLWRIDYTYSDGTRGVAAVCLSGAQALQMTRYCNEAEATNRYEMTEVGFWDAIFTIVACTFKVNGGRDHGLPPRFGS